MIVQVQPLLINPGPSAQTVYLCIRCTGRHKDIEQVPDSHGNCLLEAREWAAERWRVMVKDVVTMREERVEI